MTPRIPEKVLTWLVDWSLVPSLTIRGRRETPTTMMMRTKKTRKTRTGTKNRRSSENPTNSAAHSRLRQARVGLRFRAAGLAWAVLTVADRTDR
jgi:hypothetical protein